MKGRKLFILFLYSLTLLSLGVFLADQLSIPENVKAQDTNYLLKNENKVGFIDGNEEHSRFAVVAKNAMPAVVSIKVERSVEYRQSLPFEMFGGSPFSDFFGRGRNYQEREPKKQIVRNQGSGFVYSTEGYIMTNNHVVEEADKIIVKRYNGDELEATVVGRDPETDLAVIKVDKEFKESEVLPLGKSANLWVGDYAIAIGSPYSLEKTVTVGVVSAKGRHGLGISGGGPTYQDFIQTDAAINPGNSGGPLLDIKGRVIGINAAVNAQAQGIGFAIPIDLAKNIENALRENGEVKRGYVGVSLKELENSEKAIFGLKDDEYGVLIVGVEKNTPGEKAGLKADDVIIGLNGNKISDYAKFRLDIASHKPGDKVELTIIREGDKKDIDVKLGDRSEYAKSGAVNSKGDAKTNTLGMDIRELSDGIRSRYKIEAEEGVFVQRVNDDSKAFGKLQAGDVITKVIFNAKHYKIESISDFKDAIKKAEKKDVSFLVKFIRNGQVGTTVIDLK